MGVERRQNSEIGGYKLLGKSTNKDVEVQVCQMVFTKSLEVAHISIMRHYGDIAEQKERREIGHHLPTMCLRT